MEPMSLVLMLYQVEQDHVMVGSLMKTIATKVIGGVARIAPQKELMLSL
jgi:hypothetical protein